jgi:hypothetical protein
VPRAETQVDLAVPVDLRPAIAAAELAPVPGDRTAASGAAVSAEEARTAGEARLPVAEAAGVTTDRLPRE